MDTTNPVSVKHFSKVFALPPENSWDAEKLRILIWHFHLLSAFLNVWLIPGFVKILNIFDVVADF